MLKLKNVLVDIVVKAYPNNKKLERYKKFYVEVSSKICKSKHGHYEMDNRKIVIFNTYRDDEAIICTTIHELAHHVDNMNRNTTDHSKEFYAVYRTLLFTALDMNIISKEKFLLTAKDASDSNKVRVIMDKYEPSPVSYKENLHSIAVKNGYPIKEVLSKAGYIWNGNAKTWEKETDNVNAETEFLDEYKAEYEISSATQLSFKGCVKVGAYRGAYEARSLLSKIGFHWKSWKSGKKLWIYEAENEEDAKKVIEMFPEVEMKVLK